MVSANPRSEQTSSSARITRLSETVVNQIAAGEVVERPASVVKELLENAIDAGASRIDVMTSGGGKRMVRVSDDGYGMNAVDLALAVERHCTSKLGEDLMDIRSLGFRGEALPSIGSVSRMTITSRHGEEEHAWQVKVDGGRIEGPVPASLPAGSTVEVADLFFATPARLKFLKSDQAETNAITEVFKRTALAFPQLRFTIGGEDRTPIDYLPASTEGRTAQVLGKEFRENAIAIEAERDGVLLRGLASVPTYHRGNAQHQYFFVNGRPVKDKALLGAVRGAYADFLPSGRHPSLVLFLELDPREVDVNVHPAKADVRFRDAGLVRGLVVGALKQALSSRGPLSSRAGSAAMAAAFQSETLHATGHLPRYRESVTMQPDSGFSESQAPFDTAQEPSGQVVDSQLETSGDMTTFPLGAARAQLHKNYIVAQTDKGLVIIDQHAAHERIVYETLKAGMDDGLEGQLLLVPEIVDLAEEDVNRLCEHAVAFTKLGLELERFGPGAVAIRSTPSMLGHVDTAAMVRDLADELREWGSVSGLREKLDHVAATMACHGSVRSGRILNAAEMNALLRQMEQTPNSGQCNHGRPTYIELDLKDIERLFGR